jgi:hypothetical protein
VERKMGKVKLEREPQVEDRGDSQRALKRAIEQVREDRRDALLPGITKRH